MKILSLAFITFLQISSFQTDNLPQWAEERFKSLSNIFERSNQLKPNYIEYDLNGDHILDIAIFVRKKENNKAGILFLIGGEKNVVFLAGAGNSFGSGGNDYTWADNWKLFTKVETHQTTFLPNGDIDSEKVVRLKSSAIRIEEAEGAAGLIYFNGSSFVWIHQTD